jgi:23S rRNA (cytosine1962-C5)-methyltransferase
MEPAAVQALDLEGALQRRAALLAGLAQEQTDCYRLFHGVAEGAPGLTIDRYGTLVLAQTFRAPLEAPAAGALQARLRALLPFDFDLAYNHRGTPGAAGSLPSIEPAVNEHRCHEAGASLWIAARHRGRDPWLFLDLRAGRRALRTAAPGRSVLNLFAYTCSVGILAARAGATEVWNVDFAASALDVGRRNALANGIEGRAARFLRGDCLAVLRQLAGIEVQRFGRRLPGPRLEPRRFGVVFLDPPAWAKGPVGAVDVARDYQSLFKPALLATEAGGTVIATNHAAEVDAEHWVELLHRCAAKAGRPLRRVALVSPYPDFPSYDGKPPLKVAVC